MWFWIFRSPVCLWQQMFSVPVKGRAHSPCWSRGMGLSAGQVPFPELLLTSAWQWTIHSLQITQLENGFKCSPASPLGMVRFNQILQWKTPQRCQVLLLKWCQLQAPAFLHPAPVPALHSQAFPSKHPERHHYDKQENQHSPNTSWTNEIQRVTAETQGASLILPKGLVKIPQLQMGVAQHN